MIDVFFTVFSLILILVLGILTSYEDYKSGKIRNRWIIIFGSLGLVVNLTRFLFFSPTNSEYNLIIFISNIIIALLAGFMMFYFDLWSEGDAKLFLAFCILLPLEFYQNNPIIFFPGINLLINIFIPYTVYVIVKSIFKSKKRDYKKAIRKIFNQSLIWKLLAMFSISWIVRLLLLKVGVVDVFSIYLITFLAVLGLQKIVPEKHTILLYIGYIVVALFRLFFDNQTWTVNFWLIFFVFFILYNIVLSTLINLTEYQIVTKIKTHDLKINDKIYSSIAFDKNKNSLILLESEDQNFKITDIKIRSGTNIQNTELEVLRKNKAEFSHISIYHKIPFAPIMLAGIILTIILKGNVLISAINLFNSVIALI